MTIANRAVLVIEDEASVLAFIRAALERCGYAVVGVTSGVRGLEMLAADDYAGVISDMRTPGGVGGQEVYRWIAQFRPELARRMLFITGDTVNLQTLQALRTTGVPFIEKPFRAQELMQMVRRVIGAGRDAAKSQG
ncbi:MAG: response regulator [Candidatus Korobacteraceae bacterium]|jgi:two-component system NtrC family sensor kinase